MFYNFIYPQFFPLIPTFIHFLPFHSYYIPQKATGQNQPNKNLPLKKAVNLFCYNYIHKKTKNFLKLHHFILL